MKKTKNQNFATTGFSVAEQERVKKITEISTLLLHILLQSV